MPTLICNFSRIRCESSSRFQCKSPAVNPCVNERQVSSVYLCAQTEVHSTCVCSLGHILSSWRPVGHEHVEDFVRAVFILSQFQFP